MGATESLRMEHQILRANLRLLEVAMQMVPEAPFVLREMCGSLAQMLEDHIWHETEALQPYSGQLQGFMQARMARDHADQQIVLRDVNTLLLRGFNVPTSHVVLPLTHLIGELLEHMGEEERELFPLIDRVAAAQSQELGLTHDAIGGQEDCRTVERCGEVSV